MSDFQTAMALALAVVLLAALVLIFQPRRPATARSGSSGETADRVAMEDRIKDVEGRLSDVEHGVKQVRTMLNALPTKDSVHAIETQVIELKGDLKVNSAQTATTAITVEKIMNWLMEEAKAKASKL